MKSVFELQRQIRCCVVRSDARGVGRYGQLGGCQSDSYESGGSVPSRGGIGVDVKVVALGQDLYLFTPTSVQPLHLQRLSSPSDSRLRAELSFS